MEILREYGVATHIYVPIIKRGVVDFAVGADWTPAAGDVKISKDGGAAANVTNLPSAIAMGNGAYWDFSLTATEMQAAQIVVTVADSATKAVEDQSFLLATYGNASARHKVNLNDSVRAGLTALPNAAAEAAGGLYTRGSGAGQINQNANGQVDTRWVAGNVTVGTNNDKTGYALSAAAVQAIWDALTTALTTVGSIGKRLVDDIDATISSRSTYAGGDTAGTTTLLSRLTATRAGNLDNLDAAISSVAAAVWNYLTASATTAGSLGKLIVDNLNATITSVKALLPAALVGGRIDASVGVMQAGVITASAHAVGAIDAAAVATDAVNEIRDSVIGAAVDGSTTLAESLRLSNAALGGKASGLSTGSPVYRDLADTKDRITATTDADGNRTAVSRNLT